MALVAAGQVANRPFRFLRIVRIIRYVRSLRMLSATIVSAIPATLKVSLCGRTASDHSFMTSCCRSLGSALLCCIRPALLQLRRH